ncbi:MAG TPA: two-component regulator propeller domain-containing protein [Vicinamibacterales bacterium]|nr:two-component regulator propeller domain-containing protein [Vicinamibacterales bacterium]
MPRHTPWTCVFLTAAMAVATARPVSTDANALLTGYTMTSWTATDGSSIGPVYSLVQDRDGYLWIGTTGGVVRFDGARFTRWETIYAAPILRADVRALALSRDGTLWAGFDRSNGSVTVAALRGGTMVSVSKGSPPHHVVTSLIEDHAGTVWAVSDSVLYRLRGGAWDVIRNGVLDQAAVVSVREDARGSLWVGTRQGVFRTADGESFELVAEGIARETSESADGTLWMTDPAHGVRRRGAPAPLVGMDGWGNRLLHDSRGNLWVGTTGQGLWRLRSGAGAEAPLVELATNQTGLSSNAVQTLLEDRDGNIWVGTMLGLHSLTPQQLTPLAAGTVVRTLLPDEDGSVWVGTASGLLRFRHVGTSWRGQRLGPAADIRSLFRDASGVAWAVTDGGLRVLSRGRLVASPRRPDTVPPCPAGAPPAAASVTPTVWRPVCAARDVVWAATQTGSVTLRRGERTLATIDTSPVATSGQYMVDTTFEDADGAMWVGGTGGIWRIRDGEVAHRGERDGLPAQRVLAITQSADGFLWLAADRGPSHAGRRSALIRLHPSDFEQAVSAKAPLTGYRLYDAMNGLAGVPLGAAAAARSADGSLWFVIGGNLTVVDPMELTRERRHAEGPARIVGATIDDRTVATADTAALPAGTRKVQIDYTALRLTSPRQTRFRYRLEGFDRDWVDAGGRRQAYYTNLAPGPYVFRVQANDNAGTWSAPEAQWPFTVRPAFHQTGWFLALCATALLLTAWGVAHTRVWLLNRQFAATLAERTRLSREIHDTMLQSLVGIALQVQAIARRCAPEASEPQSQLVALRRQVEEYIREARQAIQNLRSPMLDACGLAGAIEEIGRRTVTPPTRFDVSAEGLAGLPAVVEGELLRIAQEAVTNAARHAGAGQIHVHLSQDAGTVRLRVTDDGAGFDAGASLPGSSGHYGLTGMRERAARIGGQLTITSSARGTSVEARVPCAGTRA